MSENTCAELLVGTSGFSYSDWKGGFYPQKLPARDWLNYYAKRFATVEINLTFYRPMAESTLAKWCNDVSADFAFTFKASRIITHDKKLEGCRAEFVDMARRLAPLESRLSCILFQLPPSLRLSTPRLSAFLEEAAGVFDNGLLNPRLAIEFRHPSWYCDEVLGLLHHHGWSVVIHDMMKAGGWEFDDESLTAGSLKIRLVDLLATEVPFLYLRFHGPTGEYRDAYGVERLKPWIMLARRALKHKRSVYAYFNNTMAGAAPEDARRFHEALNEKRSEVQDQPWLPSVESW